MKLPRSVEHLDVEGNRVFLRADLNVPMSDGSITDATRIDATIPTIRHLLERNAAVIVASHMGRPKGAPDPRYSLAPVRDALSEKIGAEVLFADDCVGASAKEQSGNLKGGELLLLENLRFHAGEEQNDSNFARELASLASLYVNDAFGASHRAHASIDALPRILGSRKSAAGLLLLRELEYLGKVIDFGEEARPFVALLGGAKIKGKIEPLEALAAKADTLLIGGGMANTFLAAKGVQMGRSLVDRDSIDFARELLERFASKIVLPKDLIVSRSVDEPSHMREIRVEEGVDDESMAVDIGSATTSEYGVRLAGAGTIFWNGPMGVFEVPEFAKGTFAAAEAVAGSDAVSIVGGGESVEAVGAAGVGSRISHISTGGGASLELISGAVLPGVAALTD